MQPCQLISNYNDLTYLEKLIVHIKGLMLSGLKKEKLLKLLNIIYAYGMRNNSIKSDLKDNTDVVKITPIKLQELDFLLEKLVDSKILDKKFECDTSIIQHVIKDTFSEKHKYTTVILMKSQHSKDSCDLIRIAICINSRSTFQRFCDDRYLKEDINFFVAQKEIISHIIKSLRRMLFSSDSYQNLDPIIQKYIVAAQLERLIVRGDALSVEELNILSAVIEKNYLLWEDFSDYLLELIIVFCIFCGNLKLIQGIAEFLLNQNFAQQYCQVKGVVLLLQGEHEKALTIFENARSIIKSTYNKKKNVLPSIYGIFHILSLLAKCDATKLSYIRELISYDIKIKAQQFVVTNRYYYCAYSELVIYYIKALLDFLEFGRVNEHIFFKKPYYLKKDYFDHMILYLLSKWSDQSYTEKKTLENLYAKYNTLFKGLGRILGEEGNLITDQSQQVELQMINLLDIVKVKPKWERALDGLDCFFGVVSKPLNQQMVWLVKFYSKSSHMEIEPRLRTKKGESSWTKGRKFSLRNFVIDAEELDYLGEKDKEMIKSIKADYYGDFFIDTDIALPTLADHPHVYDMNTNENVKLINVTPELIIKDTGNSYDICLSELECAVDKKIIIKKIGAYQYNIINVNKDVAKLSSQINEGISVPKLYKSRIEALVKKAANKVNISTDLSSDDIKNRFSNDQQIMQLFPINDGIRINLIVRPFDDKISYIPGEGIVSIVKVIDENLVRTLRDLKKEKKNANYIIKQSKVLKPNKNYEWEIADISCALELLYKVEEYNKESSTNNNLSIILEWPNGKSLNILKPIGFKEVHLNISGRKDWFDFDGKVTLEENKVVEMSNFLKMVQNAQGRFIRLDENKFVALTDALLKRSQELSVIANDDGSKNSIHKLGAEILADFEYENANFNTDSVWQNRLRINKKSNKKDYKLPKNLNATLRNYQAEGFVWLSKLLHMNLGCCLADDMGLGKTIQTLTVLLNKAKDGPILVIAPASVCNIWESESRKFAPSLECFILPDTNREEFIESLKANNVLIISYGIIYQISEALLKKEWNVVVIDEAQAIKNFHTKRFKIIRQLQANNKIALSGTPIENKTEELWNLFEFLNPGFLGSRKNFIEKYTKPIEVDKNEVVRNALKRLIEPFILRRLKGNVLKELPAKTEQTILVEPSEEEKSFYEALRRQSLKVIAAVEPSKKKFSILSEITRLRRACCDSSLVNPEVKIKNSKLEALANILEDIKENNHRALIFSQYVGYLKLVKDFCSSKDISYQYLDGSTSIKNRKKRVDEFQSGMGDVFLISLKAGGAGLNLTEADYVIHLDPWWNPAIEDQASDRAHRIGQKRSVMVYKLVMKHSIEEKIIAMHKAKRELAIGLLSDTDKSTVFTEKELLKLLLE